MSWAIPIPTATGSPASSAASTTRAAHGRTQPVAALARRARAIHPARRDREGSRRFQRAWAAWASSWTCAPARCWPWCRCRISIRTIRRHARRRRRPSTAPRSAPTRWARSSRSSPWRWRSTSTSRRSRAAMTRPTRSISAASRSTTTIAQRRWLTVPEIFEYSSNIGAAKMALDVGADRQRDFLGRLGLLSAAAFRSSRRSRRRSCRRPGAPVNTMTVAFGHGISVSPLQLATGGQRGRQWRHAPSRHAPEARRTARRAGTAGALRRDLGRDAQAPAPRGRARHRQARRGRRAISSAARPARPRKSSRQRITTSTRCSRPSSASSRSTIRATSCSSASTSRTATSRSCGFATGGWVAAPAVRDTIERMASIVGIQPVDEDSPEIRRSLMVDLALPAGAEICG